MSTKKVISDAQQKREYLYKITAIKVLHTSIWVFFNFILLYMVYAVVINSIGKYFWLCLICIVCESMVLVIFKWRCPLTIVAGKYSNSTKQNFDIYLPNWLAKNNKVIYTIFFIIILCVLFFRLLNK